MTEVKQSNQFISTEFEETKTKLTSASADIKKLSTRCTDFDETVSKLENQNIIMEEKVDLESRSMRENFLFHGFEHTNGWRRLRTSYQRL